MELKKKKNYETAKNCIILSQTFFYNDESKNKKVYILEYIKKHPWLQSLGFWKDFILIMILKEFQKFEDMNIDAKINIVKKKNITDKIKPKIGEVLFSQIIPYVGNMIEFHVDKKNIVKIIDDINEQFNYLGDKNLESIYNLVFNSKEELQKVKEEIKNDKTLQGCSLYKTIIKNSQKNRGDDDDDEDDEE